LFRVKNKRVNWGHKSLHHLSLEMWTLVLPLRLLLTLTRREVDRLGRLQVAHLIL